MARKDRKDVALLIETSNAYARGLLHGVVSYVREHRPWSIYLAEHGRGDAPPNWLKRWRGDGIIARIENTAIAKAVKAAKLPTVDVSAARLVEELPWVETDDAAIGRMGAEHLLDRGFEQFGYVGDSRFNWSDWRRDSFIERVHQAGYECDIYKRKGRGRGWEGEQESLMKWMGGLGRPVGVMACYDIRAQEVLEACRRMELAVPDGVAVIGVDNDELLCDLSDPPLTSVVPNTHKTGYEAAALLDQVMSGKKVSNAGRRIEPLGVATRESTDVLAIEDRDVSRAVRFIREHACDGVNVGDVLREVPLSRRVLETRFRKLIGRTPHEEILRVQLDRVRELLVETELPLSVVAARTGFKHAEYLSVVFRKHVGVPPSVFRHEQGK